MAPSPAPALSKPGSEREPDPQQTSEAAFIALEAAKRAALDRINSCDHASGDADLPVSSATMSEVPKKDLPQTDSAANNAANRSEVSENRKPGEEAANVHGLREQLLEMLPTKSSSSPSGTSTGCAEPVVEAVGNQPVSDATTGNSASSEPPKDKTQEIYEAALAAQNLAEELRAKGMEKEANEVLAAAPAMPKKTPKQPKGPPPAHVLAAHRGASVQAAPKSSPAQPTPKPAVKPVIVTKPSNIIFQPTNRNPFVEHMERVMRVQSTYAAAALYAYAQNQIIAPNVGALISALQGRATVAQTTGATNIRASVGSGGAAKAAPQVPEGSSLDVALPLTLARAGKQLKVFAGLVHGDGAVFERFRNDCSKGSASTSGLEISHRVPFDDLKKREQIPRAALVLAAAGIEHQAPYQEFSKYFKTKARAGVVRLNDSENALYILPWDSARDAGLLEPLRATGFPDLVSDSLLGFLAAPPWACATNSLSAGNNATSANRASVGVTGSASPNTSVENATTGKFQAVEKRVPVAGVNNEVVNNGTIDDGGRTEASGSDTEPDDVVEDNNECKHNTSLPPAKVHRTEAANVKVDSNKDLLSKISKPSLPPAQVDRNESSDEGVKSNKDLLNNISKLVSEKQPEAKPSSSKSSDVPRKIEGEPQQNVKAWDTPGHAWGETPSNTSSGSTAVPRMPATQHGPSFYQPPHEPFAPPGYYAYPGHGWHGLPHPAHPLGPPPGPPPSHGPPGPFAPPYWPPDAHHRVQPAPGAGNDSHAADREQGRQKESRRIRSRSRRRRRKRSVSRRKGLKRHRGRISASSRKSKTSTSKPSVAKAVEGFAARLNSLVEGLGELASSSDGVSAGSESRSRSRSWEEERSRSKLRDESRHRTRDVGELGVPRSRSRSKSLLSMGDSDPDLPF